MDLDIWLIIAQIINFWILFFIFKYFLWDKLSILIKERRENLKKLWNVDADVKNKIDEAEKLANEIIQEAKEKILTLEKNSDILAKQNKEKILADAELVAKSILAWARDDIEKEKLTMMNSIKSKIIDLSLRLNEKLFEKEKVNKDFMEKEINSINI